MAAVTGPRQFTVKLVRRQRLAPDIIEFCCTRPAGFDFAPGQYLQFVVNGAQRDYTLVSAPDATTLDFCLKIRPRGRFAKTILEAAPGHPFHISGPYGHFTYRRSSNPPVFVATGTGIAPFVAFCRNRVGSALLLHGVDSSDALIYQPIVQQAVDRYIPCLGRNAENERPGGHGYFTGRVTDYLRTELSRGRYDFYLCGRGAMIRNATAVIDDRFEDSRLYIENFD